MPCTVRLLEEAPIVDEVRQVCKDPGVWNVWHVVSEVLASSEVGALQVVCFRHARCKKCDERGPKPLDDVMSAQHVSAVQHHKFRVQGARGVLVVRLVVPMGVFYGISVTITAEVAELVTQVVW